MTVCGKFPSLNLSLNLSSNLSNASKIASANCKRADPFYREPTQRVGVIRLYVALRVHAAPVLPLAPPTPPGRGRSGSLNRWSCSAPPQAASTNPHPPLNRAPRLGQTLQNP